MYHYSILVIQGGNVNFAFVVRYSCGIRIHESNSFKTSKLICQWFTQSSADLFRKAIIEAQESQPERGLELKGIPFVQ